MSKAAFLGVGLVLIVFAFLIAGTTTNQDSSPEVARRFATALHTTPTLTAIQASSSASVTAEGIDAPSIDVNTSSQATVELKGSADALRLNSSSQSTATLGGLSVKTADVNLSSQSHGEVRASDSVSGDVNSQSKLTLLGTPAKVDVSTSSQGTVERH